MLNGTTRHVYEVVIDDRVQHRYPTRYGCICMLYILCMQNTKMGWEKGRGRREGVYSDRQCVNP